MNFNVKIAELLCNCLRRRSINHTSLSLLRTNTRFYENASFNSNEGVYYIQLDGKTVNTPLKNKLYTPTEQLAAAVVSEWDSQRHTVNLHQMHLTALCNTCIDNPEQLSKDAMIENALVYLHSDTLCTRIPPNESEIMSKLQQQRWDPVLEWFQNRFSVKVHWSTEMLGPEQPKQTIQKMREYLSSLNEWQLTGLRFSIDTVKSFIIPFALIENHLSLEDAVYLARLEVEMQMEKWGSVEWYHETECASQMALLSAGVLFHRLCFEMTYK